MTKKEIVAQIAAKGDLTQLEVKSVVLKTFKAIVDTLLKDGRIELRNFGVFEVKLRKARKARNPRTSETVFVEPKFVVTFKPGKEMEKKVRDLASLKNPPKFVLERLAEAKAEEEAAQDKAELQTTEAPHSNGAADSSDGNKPPKPKKKARKAATAQSANPS